MSYQFLKTMHITKYIRVLPYFNKINLNSRILQRTVFSRVNRINNIVRVDVSLTTNLGNTNIRSAQGIYNKTFCTESALVDKVTYERVCKETLESLCEYFEELMENCPHLNSADVTYGDGVLTVNFGCPHGTYVINRQSPNRQIWLSSPKSGPKRYDFVTEGQYWLYKHDNKTLHDLLQTEIKDIVKTEVDFSKCSYSSLRKI